MPPEPRGDGECDQRGIRKGCKNDGNVSFRVVSTWTFASWLEYSFRVVSTWTFASWLEYLCTFLQCTLIFIIKEMKEGEGLVLRGA